MTKTRNASVVAALVAISLLACNEEKAKPEPLAPPTATAMASTTASFAPVAAIPAAAESVSGTVAETMDAGGYTYVKLTTASGEKWAAVPLAKVALGDKVTIVKPTVMKNFASPTLKRTFDEILFGTLDGASAVAPATPMASAKASGAPSAASSGPVAKAAGPTGRTIAEVFAGKTALKDKPVLVRGRVVKFNAGILNRNWIHIVDGSGAKASGDNDLTVTTQGEANVGDVVVVRGVLHLDKDFGGGYSYAVIIEDATLEK